MAQPVFISPPGHVGTVPEGKFFQIPVLAYDPDDPDNDAAVYYLMLAGELPEGVQCTKTGLIEGVPKAIASLQGVPSEVSRDVTSRFTVRAYTEKEVDGVEVVDRVADRTFTITVTGQDLPVFTTASGSLGTYYDGDEVDIDIEFSDADPDDEPTIAVNSGALPPGLTINSTTGKISGVIEPLTGVANTALAGYDQANWDVYSWDFRTRSATRNYEFTLEISDGKDINLRSFSIFVYSKDSMTGDTEDFTADNTQITADILGNRTPRLTTVEGSLGTFRLDNFFAYKFDGVDYDGEAFEFELVTGEKANGDLLVAPPGLTLDPDTGWLYGTLPDLGAIESEYEFGIRLNQIIDSSLPDSSYENRYGISSRVYYFTITFKGNIENAVTWITPSDLGNIVNGEISTLVVEGTNPDGRELRYRLAPGNYESGGATGVYNKLPQGLQLLEDGTIAGRVSYNTFSLDGGSTTFNKELKTRLVIDETTFDREYNFTVEAFNDDIARPIYKVSSITVDTGGAGYSTATVTISDPYSTGNSVTATATATLSAGAVDSITVTEEGNGYLTVPTVTITGDGSSATATAVIEQTSTVGGIAVTKTFKVFVDRQFDEPHVALYAKAAPPQADRDLIKELLDNNDIIPVELLYRPQDPYFGKQDIVKYMHAFGMGTGTLEEWFTALERNHYRRQITLGELKTAQALDANDNVIYEVVYSEIQDDLDGISDSVTLNPKINAGDSTEVDTVYPNSLETMRNRVIDQIGQNDPGLPLWMTSKQENGQILGFTPAWVVCYTLPGQGKQIQYNIEKQFTGNLNRVDFELDRWELEGQQTKYWTAFEDSSIGGNWFSSQGETTFDRTDDPDDTTTFDAGSLKFIRPVDVYEVTDKYDKYLLFPRENILG